MLREKTRPGLAAGGRAAGGNGKASRVYSTPAAWDGQPVALAVQKFGRGSDPDGWVVVGKLVRLDGEPVLGIAHRHQHGVNTTISIPLCVLTYAEQHGARWLYLRRDATGEMFRLPLADVRRVGWLGPGAGAEVYVRITDMLSVPWRRWEYAEAVIRLGDEPTPPPCPRRGPAAPTTPPARQLGLWGGGQ